MPELIVLATIAAAGAGAGAAARSRLSRGGHRLPDEPDRPASAFWWVAPVSSVVGAATWWAVASGRPLLVPAAYVLATWVMVVLAAIDIDVHRLPDAIQLPSYPALSVLLVGCSWVTGSPSSLVRAGVAGLVLFAVFLLLALIGPSGAMGFGDVKLAGLVGMLLGWLSWRHVLVGSFGTFLLGGVIGVILLLSRRVERRGEFAYGPAILASTALTIIALTRSPVIG